MASNYFDKYDNETPLPSTGAANYFDRYDEQPASPPANYFDKYDEEPATGDKSIGENILDAAVVLGKENVKAVAGGLRDAAQGTIDVITSGANAIVSPIERDIFNVPQEQIDANNKRFESNTTLPEVPENETTGGKIARDVVRIGAGMVGVGKFAKATQLPVLATNGFLGSVGKGLISDFLTSRGTDQRLADVLKENNLDTPLTSWAETEEGDSKLVGKAKDALEGAGIGAALHVATPIVVDALKAIKNAPKNIAQHFDDKAFVNSVKAMPKRGTASAALEDDPYIRSEAGSLNIRRMDVNEINRDLVQDYADNGELTMAKAQAEFASRPLAPGEIAVNPDLIKENAARAKRLAAQFRETQERVKLAQNDPNASAAFVTALLRQADEYERLYKSAESGASAYSRVAGQSLNAMKTLLMERGDIPEDVKKKLVNTFGGEKRLKELAGLMDHLDPLAPDYLEKQQRLSAMYMKTPPGQQLKTAFLGWLLSSPATHVVNALSNSLVQAGDMVENTVAAGIGAVRRNPDRIRAGELKAQAVGSLHGAYEGFNAARAIFDPDNPIFLQGSKIENGFQNVFKSKGGQMLEKPLQALQAADEFFKSSSRYRSYYGDAYRLASADVAAGRTAAQDISRRISYYVENPTKEMKVAADKLAEYNTFQQAPGNFMQKAIGFRDAIPFGIGTAIMPFMKTPGNIIKYAFERTPLAFLTDSARTAWNAGGRERDKAIARVLLGTSAMAGAGTLAGYQLVTGAPPSDPKERAAWEVAGKQPYSVKVGDRWVSYSRLDPYGILFGMGADSVNLYNAGLEGDADKLLGTSIAMLSQNLVNKTWAQGFANTMLAVLVPKQYAGMIDNQVGGWLVPSLSAADARAYDQTARDVRSMWDAAKARSRFGRSTLLPKVDLLGRVVTLDRPAAPFDTQHGSTADYLVRFVSPFQASNVDKDPVAREMARIGWSTTKPQRSYRMAGGTVKLDNAQYFDLSYIRGTRAHEYLSRVVETDAYKRLGTQKDGVGLQQKVFQAAFQRASQDARGIFLKLHPELAPALLEDINKKRNPQAKEEPSPLVEQINKWLFADHDAEGGSDTSSSE